MPLRRYAHSSLRGRTIIVPAAVGLISVSRGVGTRRQSPWLAQALANVTAASLGKLKCPLCPLPAGLSWVVLGEGTAKCSMPWPTMLQLGKRLHTRKPKDKIIIELKKKKTKPQTEVILVGAGAILFQPDSLSVFCCLFVWCLGDH